MLTPRDKQRALERNIASIGTRVDLSDIPGAEAWLRAKLQHLAAQAQTPVVFRWLGDPSGYAVFEIGRDDDVKRLSSKCRGHWALWWLLDNPGKPFDAVAIARPGAAWPAKTVRQAIVGEAADLYARLGFPELVAAAKSCKVQGEQLHLHLPSNAVPIETR